MLKQRINELVTQHGSLRAVARVLGVDVGYLSRLRGGAKTNPSPEILRKLNLRKSVEVRYERKPK
jgi:transcriptional regulator with XRE-family HTH domain